MTDKILIDRAVVEQALDALTCPSRYSVPGHRCSHCDNDVDRNGLVRTTLRATLEHVAAIDTTEKRVEKTVESEHESLSQDDINWLKARPHIEQFIKEQDHDVTVTDRGVTFKSRGMWVDREFFARFALGIKEQGEVWWAVEWGQKNDRPFCMISKRLDNGLSQLMATHYGPPCREWVGLTPDEIECEWAITPLDNSLALGRRIEAKLKEKNNG